MWPSICIHLLYIPNNDNIVMSSSISKLLSCLRSILSTIKHICDDMIQVIKFDKIQTQGWNTFWFLVKTTFWRRSLQQTIFATALSCCFGTVGVLGGLVGTICLCGLTQQSFKGTPILPPLLLLLVSLSADVFYSPCLGLSAGWSTGDLRSPMFWSELALKVFLIKIDHNI